MKIEIIRPEMVVEWNIFKQKVPTRFSDTDPSNLIISRPLSNLFHYKTQKQPHLRHLIIFSMYLKFQLILAEVSLKVNVISQDL